MRIAMFTDIHWGAKNNLPQHNQDNLDYVNWFIQICKDSNVDRIVFLGDWYESRSAINIQTLNMSMDGARRLNSLNIPIDMLVGNHDLFNKHNREWISVTTMSDLSNFRVINDPTRDGNLVYLPYVFESEYQQISEMIQDGDIVFGHLEIIGFVLTGHTIRSEKGQGMSDYKKAKRVFSGHYHKRQTTNNVCYIGNTFPTTYGDVGDTDRGCAIYDTSTDNVEFINWSECPTYHRMTLSDLISINTPLTKARIQAVVDVDDIDTVSLSKMRDVLMAQHNLRELTFTHAISHQPSIDVTPTFEDEMPTIDEVVISVLQAIDKTDKINPKQLIRLYSAL